MIQAITWLFSKAKAYLIIVGGALVLAFAAYRQGMSEGKEKLKTQIEKDNMETRIENFESAQEIREEVDSMSDDAIRKRLQQWVRK